MAQAADWSQQRWSTHSWGTHKTVAKAVKKPEPDDSDLLAER